jgi:hypothetical protein
MSLMLYRTVVRIQAELALSSHGFNFLALSSSLLKFLFKEVGWRGTQFASLTENF